MQINGAPGLGFASRASRQNRYPRIKSQLSSLYARTPSAISTASISANEFATSKIAIDTPS